MGRAADHREVTLFEGLPFRHFSAIHADVPWSFKSYSAAGDGRSARQHYGCLSLQEIARLPVEAYVCRDAHLFFWVTGPFLATGHHIAIMQAWGFEPTAMAFLWLKVNADWHPNRIGYLDDSIFHMGLGHTTRQNAEYVILGRKGQPKRNSKSVKQIIVAPRREHSRKPDEIYRRITQYCDGPYLDLFGRQERDKWTVIGNEIDKFSREDK